MGLKPVVLGVGVGLVAAYGLTQAVTGLLFGVSVRDPLTYALATASVMAAAALALGLPARRACRFDPVTILRES